MAMPDPASANASAKLSRKLRDKRRAEKRRAARLAAMTPEERAAYRLWHATHTPGSAAKRVAARKERADAALFRAAADAPSPPPSPEAQAIRKRIAELKAESDRFNDRDLFE
ncbi:hypothetical protein [Xanthobacter pseudotagetidis]|uniref:hypothetical protein n=1 Tax=Xanthobacter pseudotagetidis TaxID=3119911 RepID=UPI00372B5CF2